jgi:hypothetical protein
VLSRLRPACLTSMLLLRKALLCMLRPSDIHSVRMRQCKANRTGHSPFKENDSLPGDDTSNGPFGLLKKRKAKPSGRHTGPGIRNIPWPGQRSTAAKHPRRGRRTYPPKTKRPTSHVYRRNFSPGPHRTLPGMSLYVSSTQEYKRKTIERSKRKKAKKKICAL